MKLNTRKIRNHKIAKGKAPLSMLTAYDFQTAKLLNESDLDMILVGDSVGNVILGYDTTVEVTLDEMITFGAAVKRGATDKFTVIDLPFGTYSTIESGLKNATQLFQKTKAEALKLEGASDTFCELISRCTEIGIPIMGHIGLTPQSVHQQGGYFTHGKKEKEAELLLLNALKLQKAGCFSIVLECVTPSLAKIITEELSIPTIGIGSGDVTDGQVLVINDLLQLGPTPPPSFCQPIADLYQLKRGLVAKYLENLKVQTPQAVKNVLPTQQ